MIKWDVLVSPFLLPVSFLWDALSFWRLWINYWLSQPDQEHLAKVARVQAQVRTEILFRFIGYIPSEKIGQNF